MPSWDLSWHELQTYSGTNPRPSDFEEYWDEALWLLGATL
ncbi:MAG: acetylxylan esterase [Thermoleophilia bacterium]|nr:acetylxylan esterase [Thermoleophilia bacterium]